MNRFEQMAAALGRLYLDASDEVRSRVEHVVDGLSEAPQTHEQLVAAFTVDTTWAHDVAAALAARLDQGRSGPPMEVVVLWANGLQAFTMPGRRIYLTRDLIEELPSDGALAFVIGHEMSHHDLGHVDAWRSRRVWSQPEWELAADAASARLLVRCGFSVTDAIDALERMERWAEERGRPRRSGRTSGISAWFRQRSTGYPSVADRLACLARLPGDDPAASGA